MLSPSRANNRRQTKRPLSSHHRCCLWWNICPRYSQHSSDSLLPSTQVIEPEASFGWDACRNSVPKTREIRVTRNWVKGGYHQVRGDCHVERSRSLWRIRSLPRCCRLREIRLLEWGYLSGNGNPQCSWWLPGIGRLEGCSALTRDRLELHES